jgi:hypothetical protein
LPVRFYLTLQVETLGDFLQPMPESLKPLLLVVDFGLQQVRLLLLGLGHHRPCLLEEPCSLILETVLDVHLPLDLEDREKANNQKDEAYPEENAATLHGNTLPGQNRLRL